MNSAIRNPQSEIPINRLTAVRVGDLIQYRYYYKGLGMTQGATSMRKVIEVIEGGAKFVVEGFFNVEAKQVMTHIPMHAESVGSGQEQEAVSDEEATEDQLADTLS